jgi:hypothetical protein
MKAASEITSGINGRKLMSLHAEVQDSNRSDVHEKAKVERLN